MWYVVRVLDNNLRMVVWNGDVKQGVVTCKIGEMPTCILSLPHRAASRLCSAMNAEIRAHAS